MGGTLEIQPEASGPAHSIVRNQLDVPIAIWDHDAHSDHGSGPHDYTALARE